MPCEKRPLRGLWLAPILAAPVAASAASAVLSQGADVRTKPSGEAATLMQAAATENVEVLDRRGAWYEVSSSSGWRGWVRLAAVRLTALTQKKPATSVDLVPAVIGVRGLDDASLARAQPDYAALEKLRQYRATPEEAERVAADLAKERSR